MKIINGVKYWGQLLLLPIYWLSFFMPRNKKLWLFGSTFGRRFADNPRYLYLYVSQHSDYASNKVKKVVADYRNTGHYFEEDEYVKSVRAVWISHNKDVVQFLKEEGYEAYYYHSPKGIWMALRGGIYIFDNYSKDINFWQSGRAVKFNLWHGVGNKRINYDNEHDKVRHPKNAWERFQYFPRRLSDEKPSHYILTTAPMMSEIFARAFQVPMEHIIETGYPRNDILFEDSGIQNIYFREEQEVHRKLKEWKEDGYQLLSYVPTFRPSESKFLEVMELSRFNAYLKEHNMILVCKLHPKSTFKKEFEAMEYSNIYHVPAEVDINSFLGEIDLMIADYSSVYSDYKLLDRPVVAFHYDYEEYSSDTRDAYFDWEEYMPEEKAHTMEELIACIEAVKRRDEALPLRQESRSRMYKQADARSCRRTVRAIAGILKLKTRRNK